MAINFNILEKALRAGDQATIRRINRYVDEIEKLEDFYKDFSDDELRSATEDFKKRHREEGESLDLMLPEAFAVAREACRRALGKFPYRVQLMGGTALHFGNIAEMKTGEGKALTVDTILPVPGERKVRAGDVKLGDYLLDRYSHPTRVTGVFPQGEQDVYLLTTVDGRTIECNLEHLWTFYEGLDFEYSKTRTTADLIDLLKDNKRVFLPHAVSLFSVEDKDVQFLQELSSKRDFKDRVFVENEADRIRALGTAYRLGLSIREINTYPGYLELHFNKDFSNFHKGLEVRSIETTGEKKEQVCFTVDNPEHLFLAGDYIVTHNTLTAVMPSYLNAISGKGVHVVTVNDYLASTQAEQMGRVYSFLGLTSAYTGPDDSPNKKRSAYSADITYGTNNEFGFDYLRDNMAKSKEEKVQRGHNFIIVDEADSILIDEARTPLIISGNATSGEASKAELVWYKMFAKFVLKMKINRDYEVDFKEKTVSPLDGAFDIVESELGINSIFDDETSFMFRFLTNALKAKELFIKDKDYVVRDGEVMIVDEHTGRTLEGRRYSEGIHQALEAKEGVEIQPETMTVATITLQNYFKLYDTLSGMTGTALSEAAELMDTYKTGVIPIPTNNPPQRIDHEDSLFLSAEAKYQALIEKVKEVHAKGQPILIGTGSVASSEIISRELSKAGIRHDVLNAKNHAREAAIISQAGKKGSVTVATNMAGRGTDILLGGNPEWDAEELVRSRGLTPERNPKEFSELLKKTTSELEELMREDKEEVLSLGGLFVIGTERASSRRVDDQLRGRSGRQGDKGESKFYISVDDELLRLFNANMSESLKRSGARDSDIEFSSKIVSKIVSGAQSQVGSKEAEQRKNIVKYDDVLTRQREVVYRERDNILENEDPISILKNLADTVISDAFSSFSKKRSKLEFNEEEIEEKMKEIFAPTITLQDLREEYGEDSHTWDLKLIKKEYLEDLEIQIDAITERLGESVSSTMARFSLLESLDEHWPLNLQQLDYLKKGIGLRSYAQKDPLVEYQRESIILFDEMTSEVRRSSIGRFFKHAKPSLGNSIKGLIANSPEKARELSQIQEALKTKKALVG